MTVIYVKIPCQTAREYGPLYATQSSNKIVIVRIVHSIDHSTAGSSAKVISRKNLCPAKKCKLSSRVENWLRIIFIQLCNRVGVPSSAIYQQFPTLHFCSLLSLNCSFQLIIVMSCNSTGSATGASVPGIAKSRNFAKQPPPIPPLHTVTSPRINFLPLFLCIA